MVGALLSSVSAFSPLFSLAPLRVVLWVGLVGCFFLGGLWVGGAFSLFCFFLFGVLVGGVGGGLGGGFCGFGFGVCGVFFGFFWVVFFFICCLFGVVGVLR